jgi:hypothetical protein
VTITGHQDGVETGSEKVVDVHHMNSQELRQLTIGQAGYKTPSRHGLVQLTYAGIQMISSKPYRSMTDETVRTPRAVG